MNWLIKEIGRKNELNLFRIALLINYLAIYINRKLNFSSIEIFEKNSIQISG